MITTFLRIPRPRIHRAEVRARRAPDSTSASTDSGAIFSSRFGARIVDLPVRAWKCQRPQSSTHDSRCVKTQGRFRCFSSRAARTSSHFGASLHSAQFDFGTRQGRTRDWRTTRHSLSHGGLDEKDSYWISHRHCARRYDVGIIAGAQLERRSEWHRCQRPSERRGWNQSRERLRSGAVRPDSSDTPEEVSFILDENHPAQLQNIVESGIPNENFLSVAQFAAQYGQSQQNINALTSYLPVRYYDHRSARHDRRQRDRYCGRIRRCALGCKTITTRPVDKARTASRRSRARRSTVHNLTAAPVRLVEVRSLRTRSDELLTVHE